MGWLEKLNDGSYGLTRSGNDTLPKVRSATNVLKNFRTAESQYDKPVINYTGLDDEGWKTLLREIGESMEVYIEKHTDKFFSFVVT